MIHKLVQNAGSIFSYHQLVQNLEQHVFETYDLEYVQNPLIVNLNKLSPDGAKKALIEYSQFVNEAIHILLDARIRLHKWQNLCDTIDHNIEEEKGLETNGIPHLELMRQGFQEDFNVDVNAHYPSEETESFLYCLKEAFRQKDNAYLAGALLAFESVSIPEFHVLDSLVNLVTKDRSPQLSTYINGHKKFEINHKNALVQSIAEYINQENAYQFSSGYIDVCSLISGWWVDLYSLCREY